MAMKEIWKAVTYRPFNESHLVSNIGRVKTVNNRILKPNTSNKGYHRYGLYYQKRIKWFSVSRLVLSTFIGNPPVNKPHAMHINDDKNNNRVDNLKWGSSQDNMTLKVLHNRQARGEKNARSILKKEQVLTIRRLYKEGSYNQSELARTFGVSHGQVWAIVHSRNWKHI